VKRLSVLAAVVAVPLVFVAPAHATVSFKSCAEAYAAGYANIPVGDPHYAKRLDRDGDGIACDNPPYGFEPHEEESAAPSPTVTLTMTPSPTPSAEVVTTPSPASTPSAEGEDLAETGGSGSGWLLAVALGLLGAGVVLLFKRRRHN
jgi:LPXTG-motif cell wall-anchored protein